MRELPPDQQDSLIADISQGRVLGGAEGRAFFSLLLQNTKEGFFADPIYGGNRDMVSWKMIGFPGARYDYRDYIGKHNQKLNLVPISIIGSSAWNKKG